MYPIDTRELQTVPALPPSRNKPKDKEKEKERKPRLSQKSQGERLKTVVRRLPPNLPEEIFWQSVQSWVSDETVTWKVYHQGKFRKRLNKENIPSRAYIAFKDEELLATFSREYDGHLFRDKAGNESIAVVEFAPFQKVPSEKKVDGRLGTIEKDEDFQSFLESLKDSSMKPFDVDTLETLAAAAQLPPQPTTTPLLEALKAEKSAQKDKETILRAHAHYKDPAVAASASASKKDDKGKRGLLANTPQKSVEASQSKRSAKTPAKGQQHQHGAVEPTTGPKKVAQGSNANASVQASAASKTTGSKPTPKSPRRNRDRERQDAKAAAMTSSSSVPSQGSPTPSNATLPTPSSILAAPSGAAAVPSTVVAPRRTRPMLGLASRHFEAALSGAGVERRARQQREQPKDKVGSETTNVPGAPSILQRDATPSGPIERATQDPPAASGGTREDNGGRGGGRGRGRGGRGRGGTGGGRG